MAKYIVQEESLVAVADAIREKTGGTDELVFPNGFAEAIAAIQAGGGGASSNWSETIVTYTSTAGNEPGLYFWTLNVSGIDLSGKKCVLVTDVSTEMVIAVILTRDSVEDDFILKSASISVSATQSSIGATHWIICTGYSRLELNDNMTLKIKAI